MLAVRLDLAEVDPVRDMRGDPEPGRPEIPGHGLRGARPTSRVCTARPAYGGRAAANPGAGGGLDGAASW
jgi:hypothetical protein